MDGHASHLTRAFLEYARESNIIVLCYPSHTTHVYQGLDVVCFGPFKRQWSAHRDEYERETGLVVQKTNFIHVMSRAYVCAFTANNIRTAFRKTGVVPFDPSIRQPSPIQGIVDAVINATSEDLNVG